MLALIAPFARRPTEAAEGKTEAVVKYLEFLQRGQNENPGPKKSKGGTSKVSAKPNVLVDQLCSFCAL
jgi:hypothetical protein